MIFSPHAVLIHLAFGADESEDDTNLHNDLFILMRKQLSSHQDKYVRLPCLFWFCWRDILLCAVVRAFCRHHRIGGLQSHACAPYDYLPLLACQITSGFRAFSTRLGSLTGRLFGRLILTDSLRAHAHILRNPDTDGLASSGP